MNKIRRLFIKLFPRLMKSQDLIDILRREGVEVGTGTVFYYPYSITVDMSRPWMVSIGEYCKITKGVIILAHDYSRSVIRRSHGLIIGEAGITTIGNNVFIGMNSVILMGSTIGNNCIVGAGSVVKGNFPDNSVIAGNPAKVICTLEQYVDKRKNKVQQEAILYASSFNKKYGRMPNIKEMGPFFPLFLERDENELKKNDISLNWNGDEEAEILSGFLSSEPIYNNYEDFVSDVKRVACKDDNYKRHV